MPATLIGLHGDELFQALVALQVPEVTMKNVHLEAALVAQRLAMGEELAVAQTLLSDGTRVDRIGVLSTRTSFFEGKISRMSSTTSWVLATYSCHHFRSPFQTAATLHSTYSFTHFSSYMYS